MVFTTRTSVSFPVAPEVAFDYLVDPANRPEWQSSLRSVERIEHAAGSMVAGVGTRWVDRTVPGFRPRLETTEQQRPSRWSEVGRWRGLEAGLTLTFEASAGSQGSEASVGSQGSEASAGSLRSEASRRACTVSATMTFDGPPWWRPVAFVLSKVSAPPIAADLRRAARILDEKRVA